LSGLRESRLDTIEKMITLRARLLTGVLGRQAKKLASVNHYSSTTSLQITDTSELVVERLDGPLEGTVVIGFNRPKSRNAFSRNLLALMDDAVESVKHDSSLRVMILRSMAPGMFCAGADLKERAKMAPSEVGPFLAGLRRILVGCQQLPVPTICAIDGPAVGGGLEVALTCDMRIASDDARIGLAEAKLAIIPGGGGTQNLTRLIGPSKAKEMIFTGRLVNGKVAEEMGIVNHCVAQNEAGDAAYQRALLLAQEIVPNGPIALRAAKMAINTGNDVDLATGLTIEQLCYASTIPTKDRMEGLTAFREKRKPQFKGE